LFVVIARFYNRDVREANTQAHEDSSLLSALYPPVRQRWLAIGVATALFIAFLIVLPFRDRQWPENETFIPIVDSILFVTDLITAVLLYSQYTVARRPAVLALAMGYLFTALIIVPHLLTFPGALAPTGLLGAGLQSTVWLYIFWHLGIPTAVIAYAWLKERQTDKQDAPRRTVPASILAVAAFVAALTWLAIASEQVLPPIMLDWLRAGSFWEHAAAPAILVLSASATALLWRRSSSLLDMWLLVVLWAWFIETLLLSMTNSRFSLVWYAGRAFGLLASSFVLLVLLYESTTLYARAALAAGAKARERERQHLALEVIAGSIAHELQQPLAAITSNSAAGIVLLRQTPPDLGETIAALQEIGSEGRRAGDIIESIRAALTGAKLTIAPIDMSELVRESVSFLRIELQSHQVSVQVEAMPGLPAVLGNKGQLVQVITNLITNAMEAMLEVTDRTRELNVRCVLSSPGSVSVSVQDSGSGVDPELAEQIFDPFFTTKARGSGLGLAICRFIIQAHGGQIFAFAAKPHGTVFQILLPAA
jgi:signal transduction histidine kinase